MRLTGLEAEPPDALRPSGVAAELALGIEVGLEPQAGFADDGASGKVTTRSSSWWNYRRCKTCGQTFRRGDLVLVDAIGRTVKHLAPGLRCGTREPGAPDTGAGSPDAGEAEAGRAAVNGDKHEFTAGLLHTWPAGLRLSRIAEDDWRLPRPRSTREAPACLYCGHTFRAGEYVVICPCRAALGEDPACGAAIHRDPAAGLPCWDNWQPGGTLTVCPTTTAKL